MAGVGKVNAMLAALEDTPNKINAITATKITNLNSITQLNTALLAFKDASTAALELKDMGDPYTALKDYIGGRGAENTSGGGTGLYGLVDNINILSGLMTDINPINIGGKLQTIGDALGLTGQQLTINNKPFTIVVNFTVTMDAKQIENIIADRAYNEPNQKGTSAKGVRFRKLAVFDNNTAQNDD
jgi:hypothetical protein